MIRVPADGPRDAEIVIVGEAPGRLEEDQRKPFVGASGQELTRMLAEAGIDRAACYVTNVCKIRPPNNDLSEFFLPTDEAKKSGDSLHGLYPSPLMRDELNKFYQEISLLKPKLVIALGNYALWALTTCCKIDRDSVSKKLVPTGIGNWRGSMLNKDHCRGLPIERLIPTYHPAAILRMWEWRNTAVADLRRAKEYLSKSPEPPKRNLIVRPSFDTTMDVLQTLHSRARLGTTLDLAADIETRLGHIACFGLAWSPTDAICIPLMCLERPAGYWSPPEEARIIWELMRLLRRPEVRVVGQNFIYDMQYIARHWGFYFPLHSDTMITQHVLFPGTPKALYYLASLYADHYVYWKDEGKEWTPNIDEDQLWEYNCKDAVYTFESDRVQQRVVDEYGLREQWQFMMDLFEPILFMMLRGILTNPAERGRMAMNLVEISTNHEHWFEKALDGIPLAKSKSAKPWYRSPTQQQKLFYDLLKLPVIHKRTTGRPTVDDEALEKLSTKNPILRPLFRKLQEYRSVQVFYNTFVTASTDHDNRMRCSYNIAGTETFRLSSSEDAFGYGTNLQNIPKGTEE